MMDSNLISKPLCVACPILFFLLIVATVPATTAFASSGSSIRSIPDSLPFLEQQQDQNRSEQTRRLLEESLPLFPSRPNVTLSLTPSSANIYPGENVSSMVQVRSESEQSISLSCDLSPSSDGGARCNINPLEVTPNASANLMITTTEDTLSPGRYTARINATTGQGVVNTTNLLINVHPTPDNPPELNLPADITQEATSSSGAAVTYTASATDDVDGSVDVTCTPASGSTFPLGTTQVDCSATDNAGNQATGSFNVIVQDTTKPELTLPSPITVEATDADGADVTYTASANDNIDGPVAIDCTPASGSTFPLGTTQVDCSATDNAGNQATGSFNVIVQDKTAPELTLPSDMTQEATSSSGAAVTYTAAATDAVDGEVPVTCTPASGSTFPLGTTQVDCSATDNAGNQATGSFNVIVQDTTKPELTLPSPITVEATSADGADVTYEVSANDNIDGPITPECTPESGSIFPIGNTTVTCTAADSSNKTELKSFNIAVLGQATPTTPPPTPPPTPNTTPEMTVPTRIEEQARSASGARVSYEVRVLDREDGNIIPQCDPPSGSIFRVGETMVRCNSMDSAGNMVSKEFSVIVHPPELPILFVIIPLIVGIAAAAVIIILIWRRRRSKDTTDMDHVGTDYEGTRRW